MQHYILGGYTKRANTGLSSVSFDSTTGTFSKLESFFELNGPTYVTFSKDKTLLFSLHKENDLGGVVVFQKNGTSWDYVDGCFDTQSPGCHLVFREASRTLYVANYHGGTINAYQLSEENKLSALFEIQRTGNSVHVNQQNSHIHYVGLNEDETVLYACDLGTDLILAYSIHDDGTLTLENELAVMPGAGPRHIAFHPTHRAAYTICELNSTIEQIEIGHHATICWDGSIDAIDPTLADTAAGAAIRITRDGKFVYASIRFHNVIVVFEVQDDLSLLKIQEIDSHGEIPRDFIIDETEHYLLVPHQDSDNICVFKRDIQTGLLTFLHDDLTVPEITCIALN